MRELPRRDWWRLLVIAVAAVFVVLLLFRGRASDSTIVRAKSIVETETSEAEPEPWSPEGDCADPAYVRSLDIALDPDGRPYELPSTTFEGTAAERRGVGNLAVVDGRVFVIDGIAVIVSPKFFAEEGTAVAFTTRGSGRVDTVDLSIIWQTHEGVAPKRFLGVRLDVPGTIVDHWGPLVTGYGTDGGVGALTSPALLRDGVKTSGGSLQDAPGPLGYHLGDHDGLPGKETFVFSNGWGDGSFPMSRGLAADGSVVSLVVWDARFPWRLAIPDGRPPTWVTRSEDALQACLAASRSLGKSSTGQLA